MTTRVKHPAHGFNECSHGDLQMFLNAGYEVFKEPEEVPAIEEIEEVKKEKIVNKYKKK